MVYSDPNNTKSIVYQHTLLSYQLKTSHWNFSRAATLHLCNMADRGEKLQQPHCYHPFSDSRDTYLTKNHYENYSPKMVPTNPTGSWTTGPGNSFPEDLKPFTSTNIDLSCVRPWPIHTRTGLQVPKISGIKIGFHMALWKLQPYLPWTNELNIPRKHLGQSFLMSRSGDWGWPALNTVKPVYNDHLMGYFSAFWSSSRWPRAT